MSREKNITLFLIFIGILACGQKRLKTIEQDASENSTTPPPTSLKDNNRLLLSDTTLVPPSSDTEFIPCEDTGTIYDPQSEAEGNFLQDIENSEDSNEQLPQWEPPVEEENLDPDQFDYSRDSESTCLPSLVDP